MNGLDIALLVILLFFVWRGFRTGLIGAIGGFLGIVVGIWAGAQFMKPVGVELMKYINFENFMQGVGQEYLAGILGFALIFIAINVAVSIIVTIINKIFHIIPFIDLTNKLFGAMVGLLGGVLAVSSIVYLLSLLPFSDTISEQLKASQIAKVAVEIAVVIKPLIPEAIKSLKAII